MKKASIKYLFIAMTSLVGCSNQTFFEEYDFNSGEYELYGIGSEGGRTYFTENVGNFVISDTATLNKIKQDWKIHLTDKRMPCGFSYIMLLMKEDTCVREFRVNLDCEYLICENEWFEFPAKLLNKYENSVTKISRQEADTVFRRVFKK